MRPAEMTEVSQSPPPWEPPDATLQHRSGPSMRAPTVTLSSYVLVLIICVSFSTLLRMPKYICCVLPSMLACLCSRVESRDLVYCPCTGPRAAPPAQLVQQTAKESRQAFINPFMIASSSPACVSLGKRCSAPRPVCLPRRCWAHQAIGGTARRVLLHTPGYHLCSASAHMAASGQRPTVICELLCCVVKEAGVLIAARLRRWGGVTRCTTSKGH